uniref:Prominin-1-A n=1 Tax=Arion vulgaris TaxID=1028688 RepID=A0A0B7BBZ8_9EUPU
MNKCNNMILCVFGATLMFATIVNSDSATNIDDNEMGMGVLYDMTNIFLGDVIHTERISNSFLNLSAVFENGDFHSDQVNDWRKWLKYLIGFSVCAAIGIVFIVVMPIVGFIFCCCRLCGRCGARPGKNAAKRAKCKQRTFCTVLTILSTIALAAVVCAFLCNSILYKHLQNDNDEGTIGNMKSGLRHIETFINTTVNSYIDYAVDIYSTTSKGILKQINDSATGAVEGVLEKLQVVNLIAEAVQISKVVNETRDELEGVSSLLSELSNETKQLQDNLTDIKNDIESVCAYNNCPGYNSTDYNTDADYSSLDKLKNELENVDKAMGMDKYIREGQATLDKAKEDAYKQIRIQIEDADKAIMDVKDEIKSGTDELKKEKDKLLGTFPDIYNTLNDGNKDVRKYSEYVFYGGIGVCCVYLIVVVLYYIGLLFGICGERPGDGAPCCNTGCGANFLISGVAITFIFTWILMIICTVLFCVGGPAYTEICRYFDGHDPANFKDFDGMLKNAIDVKSYYTTTPPQFSISGSIEHCQQNKSLFNSLQLDYVVDLNKTLDISQIDHALRDLMSTNLNIDNITIISKGLNDSLNDMANSGLDKVNFSIYFAELSKKLTAGDLSVMASIIWGIANQTTNNTAQQILSKSAVRLQDLSDNTLPPMKANVAELSTSLIKLQQNSKLSDSIYTLISKMTSAQDAFNSNKTLLVKDSIVGLAQGIINVITNKVNSIKQTIRVDMGGCQDLSTALFTMSDALCLQALEPLNGLWFSFGWCLFFFVPCLIFAVLLAGQYRRTLDDDKEFDDPNYMMYGGPNPDTIPLTRVAW